MLLTLRVALQPFSYRRLLAADSPLLGLHRDNIAATPIIERDTDAASQPSRGQLFWEGLMRSSGREALLVESVAIMTYPADGTSVTSCLGVALAAISNPCCDCSSD